MSLLPLSRSFFQVSFPISFLELHPRLSVALSFTHAQSDSHCSTPPLCSRNCVRVCFAPVVPCHPVDVFSSGSSCGLFFMLFLSLLVKCLRVIWSFLFQEHVSHSWCLLSSGSPLNLCQMMACVGQQNVGGQRIKDGLPP